MVSFKELSEIRLQEIEQLKLKLEDTSPVIESLTSKSEISNNENVGLPTYSSLSFLFSFLSGLLGLMGEPVHECWVGFGSIMQ